MARRFATIPALALAIAVSLTARADPPTPAVNDALDGTWDLVSVIEGGKPVPLDIVKKTTVRDGRVVISGPLLAFNTPEGKLKTVAFVTDPKTTPRTIDLAGAVNMGSKGIYLRDGDTLILCVQGSDTNARPTEFVSLAGQENVLMTFRRVSSPPPAPALVKPAPAAARKSTDAETRDALVGTWGHQTGDRVVKVTLNSDGSFTTVVNWKNGFKKVFEGEEWVSGSWKVKDGAVIMTTASGSDRSLVGRVASYRVVSLNAGEVTYVDAATGERRIEWKLR